MVMASSSGSGSSYSYSDIDNQANDDELEKLSVGVHFCPSDHQILAHMKAKVLGNPIKTDPMPYVDIYKLSPRRIPFDLANNGKGDYRYFYARRRTGTCIYIDGGGGFWSPSTSYIDIKDKKKTLGFKRNLDFYSDARKWSRVGVKIKNFSICEYQISHLAFEPDMLNDHIKEQIQNLIVCKVQRNTSLEDNNTDGA